MTTQIKGHTDDVNAIAYLDDSNNVLISGSDDTIVKACFPHGLSRASSAVYVHALCICGPLHRKSRAKIGIRQLIGSGCPAQSCTIALQACSGFRSQITQAL